MSIAGLALGSAPRLAQPVVIDAAIDMAIRTCPNGHGFCDLSAETGEDGRAGLMVRLR